jgi:PelA/Pel-15E family pectate lyase
MHRPFLTFLCFLLLPIFITSGNDDLIKQARQAMARSAHYYHGEVATQGGYLYEYSADLKTRRGEGTASETEIWVQPPGTPTVGMAFLAAYEATGDQLFLDAAKDAAFALIHGQLQSGGWTASIDFDPVGKRADRYRNGKGRSKGKNYSTLDDDKTQAALCFLIKIDKLLGFKDASIHESVQIALDALLKAQFANGGFPQGWKEPVTQQPIIAASFPDYDWRTENRIKDYWDYYTLNDGLAGTVVRTLIAAYETYGDDRYRQAMIRFGDFLLLAQLPEHQPAWAQQYNFDMHPMWARKFEPPAVSGAESIDVIHTLLTIYEATGDAKYLAATAPAIQWLKRSTLPDGQIARFYELQTNRPLYFVRDTYELTYDDSNPPPHYSFKSKPGIDKIEKRIAQIKESGKTKPSTSSLKTLAADAQKLIAQLAPDGRWLDGPDGKPLASNDPTAVRRAVISSATFSKNLTRLAQYVQAAEAASGSGR